MKKINKYLYCLSLLTLAVSAILPANFAHASSTRLYIEAPTDVKVGEKFTVKVLASSGPGGGNRSRVDLVYPSDMVSVVSTNTNNSVFGGNSFPNDQFNNTHGRITHLAYPIPAPQGQSLLIFSAVFSTKKTGAVNFSFSADSVVNDSIPEKPTRAINIVAKSCPAGQTGTPPNCSQPNSPTPSDPQPNNPNPRPSPSPSRPSTSRPTPNSPSQPAQIYPGRIVHPSLPATPLPAQTPAPPSDPVINTPDIVNQQILDSELDIITLRTATRLNRAELIWELNHPSNTTFKYGKSADELNKEASITRESDSRFYTDIRNLEPGETYYYTIAGQRTNGSGTMSQSGTFSTKGFGVEIKALQQDGAPLANAQISFDNTGGSVATNEEGIAYIQVRDGEYTLNITKGSHSSTHQITVDKKPIDDEGDAEIQKIELKTSATAASVSEEPTRKAPSAVAYIITIMVGIIFMTIIGFIIYFRKRTRENQRNSVQNVVVIEDDWSAPPR